MAKATVKTLTITTVTGKSFEETGHHRYDAYNKIHYINGRSYPDSIVEVKED